MTRFSLASGITSIKGGKHCSEPSPPRNTTLKLTKIQLLSHFPLNKCNQLMTQILLHPKLWTIHMKDQIYLDYKL
jgi:hypothetical protein